MSNWKRAEREAGKLFGVTRRPLSGSNSRSGGRDDIQHPRIYLESKYSSKSSLWTLYRETREKANKEDKLPVLSHRLKGANGELITCLSSHLVSVAAEVQDPEVEPGPNLHISLTPQEAKLLRPILITYANNRHSNHQAAARNLLLQLT